MPLQPLRLLLVTECGEACRALARQFKLRTGWDIEAKFMTYSEITRELLSSFSECAQLAYACMPCD